MQGDWTDVRFNNYILEHGYRWMLGFPGHERFWSPPVFYPATNTAAYSDVLLCVAPLYWPLRVAGLAPERDFQFWMLALATLNFASAFVLFWRGFRCRPLASAAGAVVLSFAAMRTSQVMHAQLIAHFYIVLAIFALLRVFEPEPELRAGVTIVARRTAWIFALAIACVAQLYSGVYNGWFLCFALLIAALWTLVFPRARRRLVLTAHANARALAIAAGLAALALAPFATHYLGAGREVGVRSFAMVEPLLPRVESWAYLGSHSWLYGWLDAISRARRVPPSRAAVQIRRRDQRRRTFAVAAIVAVVVAEQGGDPPSYDKLEGRMRVARVAAGIGASCEAFLYTTMRGDDEPWSYQVDAMWASMESGVPTINGYSGGEPPGWSFYDVRVKSAQQDSLIAGALANWGERWKLDTARVCRVRTPGERD